MKKGKITPNMKRIGRSKIYKYVYEVEFGFNKMWRAEMPQYKYTKSFPTERAAAIAVDLKLISLKKDPINVLVRKQSIQEA